MYKEKENEMPRKNKQKQKPSKQKDGLKKNKENKIEGQNLKKESIALQEMILGPIILIILDPRFSIIYRTYLKFLTIIKTILNTSLLKLNH